MVERSHGAGSNGPLQIWSQHANHPKKFFHNPGHLYTPVTRCSTKILRSSLYDRLIELLLNDLYFPSAF